MPIKTGATLGAYSKSNSVLNTKPTSKWGAAIGGHSVSQKSQAEVNSGATKRGAEITAYSSAMAILLSSDDF